MGLLSSVSSFFDKKKQMEDLNKGLLDIAGTKNPADVDMNKAAAMGRQLTGLQQQIGDGGLGDFMQHAGREFGANILNKTGLSNLGIGTGGDPLMQKHDMGDQGALPAIPTPMQAALNPQQNAAKKTEVAKMDDSPSVYYDQIKQSGGDNKDKMMKLFKAFSGM